LASVEGVRRSGREIHEIKTMRKIIQRGMLPALLLAGGIASLTYGVKYHAQEVFNEKEIEVSLAPPEFPPVPEGLDGPGMDAPPGFDDPMGFGGDFGGPGGGMPFPGPPPELQNMKQIVLVGSNDLEPILVREVTFGGLELLPSGELKRTYTGTPPSLCPT